MKKHFYSFLHSLPHDIIAFIAALITIVGMYSSRILISVGMITLFCNAIINHHLVNNLKQFFTKKHLLIISGYFVLIALSYFWSQDKSYYANRMQILFPFLVLPFSFFSISRWEIKWYDILMIVFIVLNVAGILWSTYQYLGNKEIYDIGYGFSKVIPTPFKSDHIRFSLAVLLSSYFCIDLITRYSQRFIRFILLLILALNIIYIHILAVKTGLVGLYMSVFIYSLYAIFSLQYKKTGVTLLLLFLMIPFVMYITFPSFKNKIGYLRYTWQELFNEKKQANISDEGRIISYKYAIEIIKANKWIGVGIGDVKDEMELKYKKEFAEEEFNVLLPHNQFLMAGVAIGLVGILYLAYMMFLIFSIVKKNDYLYFTYCILMLFAMMIEPMFETQYGTCMFLFFLLLLMKRSKYYLA